jgi:hypothetical protein
MEAGLGFGGMRFAMNRKQKIALVVATLKKAGGPLSGHTILEAFHAVGASFDAYHEGLTHAIRLNLVGDTTVFCTGLPFRAYYAIRQTR